MNSYLLNSLAELNWKICIDALDDAVEATFETRERLEKALDNLNELRDKLEK